MRKALMFGLSVVFVLAMVEAAGAQPRVRGMRAQVQRASPSAQYADDGYFGRYITGPGGQQIPLRDYPGSAYVVTRKMMDDFGARNVCEALRFAPGVVASGC